MFLAFQCILELNCWDFGAEKLFIQLTAVSMKDDVLSCKSDANLNSLAPNVAHTKRESCTPTNLLPNEHQQGEQKSVL